MAKKSNHRTVVFLQDYANKKEGDDFTCDGMLASSLVQRGVAAYKTEPKEEEVNVEFNPLPEITEETIVEQISEPVGQQESPVQTETEPDQNADEATSDVPAAEETTDPENVEEAIDEEASSEPAEETKKSKSKSSSKSKNKK